MRIHTRALVTVAVAAIVMAAASLAAGRAAQASPASATATDLQNAPVDAASADVDAYLRERMDATKTPGMAYAIVSPQSIEHVGTMGEDGNGDPITADTPFLWGSVAKPVTATAVMTLVEGGTIDLDEPVRSYLPGFTLADDKLAAQISVRHLLQQTSGIPEGTGVTDRFDRRPDPYADAVADLSDVELLSAPGDEFQYASENYLVLGALVEAVAGRPFHEYLREHVLDPLGMTGAIATPDDADAAVSDGHSYAFGQPFSSPMNYDQTGPSYGYLGGTVEDLASFAMTQLNDGAHGSTQILERDSVELMHCGTAPVTETVSYGLGWRDDARNDDLGTSTIWHSGAVSGYQATVVLLPELDRGIVVLQNIYGYFQDWELVATGLHAARILAGGEPEPITSDMTYQLTVGGLVAVLGGTLAAAGWPVFRILRRPTGEGRRRRTVIGTVSWTVAGLALAYLAGVVLPDSVGASLRLIRLWAPDVGWLLVGLVAASLLLAASRLITGIRRLLRPGTQ